MDGSDEIGNDKVLVGQPIWSTFRPRWFRLALAFLTAPIAASFFFSIAFVVLTEPGLAPTRAIFEGFGVFTFALIFAVPGSLILGGPLYTLLIGLVRPRITVAVLGGACIGVIICVACLFLIFGLDGDFPLPLFVASATAGSFGGVLFWLCAMWRDPRLSLAGPLAGLLQSQRDTLGSKKANSERLHVFP